MSSCNGSVIYSRSELVNLKKNICPGQLKCSATAWRTITSLGIQSRHPTHRGVRAGRRKLKSLVSRALNKHVVNSNHDHELTVTRNQHFLLCCWNAQSLRNKASVTSDYIIEHNIDAIAITESWLKNTGDEPIISEVTPAGYSYNHFPRAKSTGGGIAFIYKSCITVTNWKPLTKITTFEAVEITLCCHGITFKVIIVYRPPPNTKNRFTVSQFLDEFGTLLESSICNGHLAVIGDFNFHWTTEAPIQNIRRFQDLVNSFNLTQWVNDPTHTGGHTLDLVFTNTDDVVHSLTVDNLYISDHFPILVHLILPKPPLIQKRIKYRSIKSVSVEDLQHDIDSLHFHESVADVETAVSRYNSGLAELLEKHAPLKTRLITVRPDSKWYTPEIAAAKKLRRSLERKWRSNKIEIHRQIYRNQCRIVNNLIRNAKTKYYSNIIEVNCNDQKALFKFVSSLCKSTTTSPLPAHSTVSQLTETFNEYFREKIANIRKSLDADTPNVNLTASSTSTVTSATITSFRPTSTDEVYNIIKRTPSKSCCLDPIPTHLLKKTRSSVIPLITTIINLSLQHGTVPSALKSAIVTPLLKKPSLDPDILKNYRPISNLPFISKVLEKVIAARLNEYLSTNSLFEPLQSAYKQFHSTETALIKVHNDIIMSLDTGHYVILVLLDLSAAFDTIDHAILLERLSTLGIQDLALEWLSSYITDRTQSININGQFSSETSLHYGVPQGSVLGPLLFSLYITPLGQIIRQHNVKFHQYADDNQLYLAFTRANTSTAVTQMEEGLQDIKTWMQNNKLQLNDGKTEVMLIRSKFDITPSPVTSININSTIIKPVTAARNLGVMFDNTLQFHKHIVSTCQSIYFIIRRIGQIRKYLSTQACLKLIHSTLVAKLDYGNALLYGLPTAQINLLQRAQNSAARLITRTKKYDHITPVLQQLHWLPVTYRIQFKILLITYKALHDLAPQYISDLIKQNNTCRTLRSSNKQLLSVPKTRLKSYGDRSFSHSSPSLWNHLPNDIRTAPSVEIFKSRLKTHLFQRAFL